MRKTVIREPWQAGLLLLATTMIVPMAAHAQAWLPAPGQGSIYFGYQYAQAHWTLYPVDVTGVKKGQYTLGPGKKGFDGDHYDQSSTVNLDYGIRHGMAASVKLAYITSRYIGLTPHRRAGQIMEVDNGHYHGFVQDAEVAVYQTVLSRPFVATPFVGYVFPVQDYEARGHAAIGHHLRELRLGATLGRPL